MTESITRTVVVDLTPEEMAALFAGYTADDQAAFFDALRPIVDTWPALGWRLQCNAICERLPDRGASVLADLCDAYITSITP